MDTTIAITQINMKLDLVENRLAKLDSMDNRLMKVEARLDLIENDIRGLRCWLARLA